MSETSVFNLGSWFRLCENPAQELTPWIGSLRGWSKSTIGKSISEDNIPTEILTYAEYFDDVNECHEDIKKSLQSSGYPYKFDKILIEESDVFFRQEVDRPLFTITLENVEKNWSVSYRIPKENVRI